MSEPVLVLNTGSSSIKYELINPRTRARSARGGWSSASGRSGGG
ncbi:hypothetical protein [Nonomuraea salmonea]